MNESIIVFLPKDTARKCACNVETKSAEINGEKKEWQEIVMCVYHSCIRHRDPKLVKELLMQFIGKLG